MLRTYFIITIIALSSACSSSKKVTKIQSKAIEPTKNFSDENPLIIFESETLDVKDESLKKLEKTFQHIDTTKGFLQKFYLVLTPVSCTNDLEKDKYIGVKRAAVLYDIINKKFNGKLYVSIDPKGYDKEPSSFLGNCIESGVYIIMFPY